MSERTYKTAVISVGLTLALTAAPLVGQDQPAARVRPTATELEVQVFRLASQLAAQRSVEAELNKLYSSYLLKAEKEPRDEERLRHEVASRQVLAQIEESAAARSQLMRRLEAICSAGEKPRGWFGVALQGDVTVSRQAGGANIFHYSEHQTVVTVEPGSPADKAGIRAQDVIVAVGGRDLRAGDVIASELLRPGAKVPVTLIRGGDRENVIVNVEERPETFEMTCPWVDRTIATAMAPAPAPQRFAYKFLIPDSSGQKPVARVPRPAAVGSSVQIVSGAYAGGEPMVVYAGPLTARYANGTSIVAGAQLMPMTKDLSEVFGVDDGLIVLRVVPGTLAHRSGLKGGDVLLRANNLHLTSPRVFERALGYSRDGEVKVTILRQKQQQVVTLKW